MDVIDVKYLDGYKLEVTFEDGKVILADFTDFLKKSLHPAITKYRKLSLFKKVTVDKVRGCLEWNKGEMDINPYTLYEGRSKGISVVNIK